MAGCAALASRWGGRVRWRGKSNGKGCDEPGAGRAGKARARGQYPIYYPPEKTAAIARQSRTASNIVPAQLGGMQYLYGSGEAAALPRQSWRTLAAFVD